MTMRLLFSVLILLTQPVVAQVGSDNFYFVAQRHHSHISDIAVAQNNLYLLMPNALAVSDLDAPGIEVGAKQIRQLQTDFDRIRNFGDELWLWSSDGVIARLVNPLDNSSELREWDVSDSVLAVTRTNDLLVASHSFNGISVYANPDDPQLHRLQLIDRGVHYLDVISQGDVVVAVDDYNGLELYRVEGDSLVFTERILSLTPLKHVTITDNRIASSDRSDLLQLWEINSLGQVLSHQQLPLDFGVTALTNSDGAIIMAGDGGQAGILEAESLEPTVLLTAGLSAERIEVATAGEAINVATIDALSNVAVYPVVNSQVMPTRSATLTESPNAVAFAGVKALASGSRGISELTPVSGELMSFSLWENGAVVTDLASTDSVVFAVSSSDRRIFALTERAGKYRTRAITDLAGYPRELHLIDTFDDNVYLGLVSFESITLIRYNLTDFTFTEVWNIDLPFAIKVADIESDALVAVSDHGDVYYSSFDPGFGPDNLPLLGAIDSMPQAVLLNGEYLAAGYLDSLSIYHFDLENGVVQHSAGLDAIKGTNVLAFEPSSSLLLVGSDEGIQYADYSNPASPGTVYSLPDTRFVRDLVTSDGRLLVVSKSTVQLFETSNDGSPVHHESTPAIAAAEFYPNPFNTASVIQLSLTPESLGKPISFEIVNLLGQRIWRETKIATSVEQNFTWTGASDSGTPVASGVYFFRAAAEGSSVVRKLVYLK